MGSPSLQGLYCLPARPTSLPNFHARPPLRPVVGRYCTTGAADSLGASSRSIFLPMGESIGITSRRSRLRRQSCFRSNRPEQTTLYRLVQQHAQSFFAQTEEATGAGLPQFVKDEFDAFLECGILAHGFLRLDCAERRGHADPEIWVCGQSQYSPALPGAGRCVPAHGRRAGVCPGRFPHR